MYILFIVLYILIFIPTIINIYRIGKSKNDDAIKSYKNIKEGNMVKIKISSQEKSLITNKMFEVKKIVKIGNNKYAVLYDHTSGLLIRRNVNCLNKVEE